MIKQRGWGKAPRAKGSPGERGKAAKKSRLVEANVVGRPSYRKRSYRRAGTEPPFNIANLLFFFFFPGRLRQVFLGNNSLPPSFSILPRLSCLLNLLFLPAPPSPPSLPSSQPTFKQIGEKSLLLFPLLFPERRRKKREKFSPLLADYRAPAEK